MISPRIKFFTFVAFSVYMLAFADVDHSLEAQGSRTWTSDGWKIDRLIISPHKAHSDLLWPYSTEPEIFNSWDILSSEEKHYQSSDFLQIHQLEIQMTEKISHQKSYFFNLGISQSSLQDNTTQTFGLLQLYYQQITGFGAFDASLSQKNISNWIQGSTHWMQQNQAIELQTHLHYYPKENLHWNSSFQQLWMTDGNQRHQLTSEWMYGLSTSTPWIWIGPGFEFTQFQSTDSNYWSPKKMLNYGLHLDASTPLFSEKWTFIMGGSVHSLQENDSDVGHGHYVNFGISYGKRETQNASLKYEDIRSQQNSNTWESHAVLLQWSWKY